MPINNLSELTADAINQFRKAAKTPMPLEKLDPLNKAITNSTGLVWYDLQAPAKNLFPVLTPIRNKIPRVAGNGGTATNWIAVTAINTARLRGFVPEGGRNGTVTLTATPKSAAYKSHGLEDSVTFEAELSAVNFEDIRATTAQRLLWSAMIEEEIADLGANYSLALTTCPTPSLTTASTTGTIGAGTYKVYCVALTMHGYLASAVNATGVPGLVSVTDPLGTTFTYGSGASQVSAAATTAALTGATNVISAYVTAVNGATAYAWYVDDGASGAATLQSITTINSVKWTSLTTTNQALASVHSSDHSTNQYAFDGILSQAFTASSGAYIKTMATGTPGTGTGLTSDSAGGITEIDEMLVSMWNNYKLGPTVIYVNAQEAVNISKKILGASGANYRFVTDNPSPNLGNLTGGARVMRYVNKVGLTGRVEIPIEIHPYLPAGTLLALTESLPYPMPNVANPWEMKVRRDYYQMEWPLRSRKYESGVYFDGVLAGYFPPSVGIITNIANA